MSSAGWSRRPALRALLAGLLLLAAPVARAQTEEALAVVESTVGEVLAILQDGSLDSSERIHRIDAIARERFDWETMSRLVLRRAWKKFDAEERQAFLEAFRDYLAASYGHRLDRYDQQDVKILGARVEPRGDVTVKTRIVGGSADDVGMDYRMRERNGAWRVVDVKIEGVSLVSNFRSQFSEVLSHGGPDEVLRRLREKTAEMARQSRARVPARLQRVG